MKRAAPLCGLLAVALVAAVSPSLAAGAPATAARATYFPDVFQLKIRPRLLVYGPHAAIKNVRWRAWGEGVAYGRGTLDYSDFNDQFRTPVRVTASRIGRCGSKRTYRYVRVTLLNEGDRRRYPGLASKGRRACPSLASAADVRDCPGSGRFDVAYYGSLSVRNMTCRRGRRLLSTGYLTRRGAARIPRYRCRRIGSYGDGAIYRCTRSIYALRVSIGG
jgi:hypothetical protein